LSAPNLEEERRGRRRLIGPLAPLQDGVYALPSQRQGASQLSARELNIGGRALLQGARLATHQAAMAVFPRVRVHSLGNLAGLPLNAPPADTAAPKAAVDPLHSSLLSSSVLTGAKAAFLCPKGSWPFTLIDTEVAK
jgi:hypothetical protein